MCMVQHGFQLASACLEQYCIAWCLFGRYEQSYYLPRSCAEPRIYLSVDPPDLSTTNGPILRLLTWDLAATIVLALHDCKRMSHGRFIWGRS